MTTCTQCGCNFYADEKWKKRCLPCWQKSQTVGKASGASRELLSLKMQNIVLETKLRCAEAAASRNTLGPVMLAKLIRLAHPDKHANSPAANEVTAWLLSQRGPI